MQLSAINQIKNTIPDNRFTGDKNWVLYRILSAVLLAVSTVNLVISILIVESSKYNRLPVYITVCLLTFAGSYILRTIMIRDLYHAIKNRLNEHVWIEAGHLCHFLQTSFGHNSDKKAYLFVVDVATIKDAKYDSTSGRIELTASGTGIHYSDYSDNIIDREWVFNDLEVDLYDSPHLLENLINHGVQFRETEIKKK